MFEILLINFKINHQLNNEPIHFTQFYSSSTYNFKLMAGDSFSNIL